MAISKTTAPAVEAGAFTKISVDIASIPANSSLDVQVPAPRSFKVGRPVLVFLAPDQTALNTGVQLQGMGRCIAVSGVKKIEFRVSNHTGAAIDPTARTFYFLQL